MEYIVNTDEDVFQIILFEYESKRWEIMIDKDLDEQTIQGLITRRILELNEDFLEHQSFDFSHLYVDYTTNKQDEIIE
jgi:hypothetical protein